MNSLEEPNTAPQAGALAGVTVVSLEHAVAAPFATRQMADLGARVIKIERPGAGDFARSYDSTVRGMSSHFVWVNRGKESLELDLGTDAGQEVLDTLLDRTDVFVHNVAPAAARRLRVDADSLSTRHERLIVCQISGYGCSGPYQDAKAYDLLVQCEAGILSITGTEEFPSKVGIPLADIGAGVHAFAAVMSALYERERTGRPSVLDVSMLDVLAEWVGFPLYYTRYGGIPLRRTGAHHAAIAPYGPFAAHGGDQIFLAVQNDAEWASFCTTVLERPDLVDDPRYQGNSARCAHSEELREAIGAAFAALTVAQVEDRLESARIAHARLRSIADLPEHPQIVGRDRWRTVDSPVGPLQALLPPVIVRGREATMGSVPDLGEHTAAILAELGYGARASATSAEARHGS